MSENSRLEDPPQEGEPFDYDAVPERFYFDVESTGMLEPDQIVQNGIKVLQEKLASLIHGLNAGDEGDAMNGDYNPRSPEYTGGGDNQWGDGFTTPYGNGGNQSSWGGGGTTPYGTTTPYGNPGQGGWGAP